MRGHHVYIILPWVHLRSLVYHISQALLVSPFSTTAALTRLREENSITMAGKDLCIPLIIIQYH